MSTINNILIILVDTLGSLFLIAVLMRFFLQWVRADFYNPISQAIVKITAPILNPFRRIIPSFSGLDIASLVLAYVVSLGLVIAKIYLKMGYFFFNEIILTAALIRMITSILNIYFFSLIIIAIASWVASGSSNPGLTLLHELTEPLCRRVRNIIPPVGGLDFSVMILLLGISILEQSLQSILVGF